jgi:hypothetical protein
MRSPSSRIQRCTVDGSIVDGCHPRAITSISALSLYFCFCYVSFNANIPDVFVIYRYIRTLAVCFGFDYTVVQIEAPRFVALYHPNPTPDPGCEFVRVLQCPAGWHVMQNQSSQTLMGPL